MISMTTRTGQAFLGEKVTD